MIAAVICNGYVENYAYIRRYLDRAEFIVCADGGAVHMKKMGVNPHVLVGDFDSISPGDLDYYRNAGVEVIDFPKEKDLTDAEIAANLAMDRGAATILLLGGWGTRMDHSLANAFMLKKMLDRGVQGVIANEYNEMTVIKDRIVLDRIKDFKVTLLPLSERVEGVTTKGLYYPLDNATITMGSTWGVSNEFISDTAEVTIKKGLLLVIKSRD